MPALALREALINAVCHRDYTQHSASIALAIYDDRLELWNNGKLSSKLKLEDLKKPHQSCPRNEEIATIFYLRGWVEGWGTGTTRMMGYCQNNDTPEPEFEEYSSGFAVVFPFKERMHTDIQKSVKVSTKYEPTFRQLEILEILATWGELSMSDIAKHLVDAPSNRTVQLQLSKLKEAGFVALTKKGKASKWFLMKK